MGGDDSAPSVIPKLLEGEVLRWQDVVLGAPGAYFLLCGIEDACFKEGKKSAMCHPDGHHRQNGRYLGPRVWEESLSNLDGSRSRLDGGMSNEGVFERN